GVSCKSYFRSHFQWRMKKGSNAVRLRYAMREQPCCGRHTSQGLKSPDEAQPPSEVAGAEIRIGMRRWTASDKNFPQHSRRFDSGEPGVETLRFVGKARVVDAETMQHRRVQIVNTNRFRDHVVGELVGLPI